MAGTRHYAPAVLVHRPDCPDVPAGLAAQSMATATIAARFPNGVQHHCYHHTINPRGVPVRVSYPQHRYKPSTVFPDDAVRALCDPCRGTHEGEDVGDSTRPAVTTRLFLPTNRAPASRTILPGNVRPGENLRFPR